MSVKTGNARYLPTGSPLITGLSSWSARASRLVEILHWANESAKISIPMALVLVASGALSGYAQSNDGSGPEIVAKQTVIMTQPPAHVPSGTVVDGPILGNGDLGIAIGGPPEQQRFYMGKNDFWSHQAGPLSVGGLRLDIPDLEGASYRQEQDLAKAEVGGIFTKGALTIKMRSWVAATENLAVTELSADGAKSVAARVKLFPSPTKLSDNNKPVNLGREQKGDGRWYFDGLLDEVYLYDRALPGPDVQALTEMRDVPQGLVRHWGFDAEGSGDTIGTNARLMLGRTNLQSAGLGSEPATPQLQCPGPLDVLRPVEQPVDDTLRCMPDGYSPDYQRYSIGKRGRAVKLVHELEYVDAGLVPALQQVTVTAWIYVFKAGDANFILSKGEWNEAYSLQLDHGRLRFNVGDRFVRSVQPIPVLQWTHVAGTFDGSRVRAYINGEEVLPPARYVEGGASASVLWISRNADGPLDEQYEWPNPLPPTSTLATKGREVTFATRLLGAQAKVDGDEIQFELEPGRRILLITSVLSDLDNPEHLTAAPSRVAALTPAALEQIQAVEREWWKKFWSESWVETNDLLIDKFYYSSQYIMASASRTGKVMPGLYGNWVTTDHPSWNGDYTLNYNTETPYSGLYSSNHIAITDPYDQFLLDFVVRGKAYARTLLNVRGVYYPGHMGPWGMERPFDYEPFMGQKIDAAYSAIPMLMRFYSTYDRSYAQKVYPFILEVGNFWEDYLKFENGRYADHDDCVNEVGPWLPPPDWSTCVPSLNPINELGFLRAVFKGLINMSGDLGVDASRRAKWQDILDRLSKFPMQEIGGKVVFQNAENSPENVVPWDMFFLWPGRQVGLDSDPKLLAAARNTIAQIGFDNYPHFAPAMATVGVDPNTLLADLRKLCQEHGYPNGYIFFPGGGVEAASTVPATINEMLLQSHEGILRFFPVWPRDKEARFGNIRAYGAFLVSSEFAHGKVQRVLIVSEKGKPCFVQNPWPGKTVVLYRNGRKAESVNGPQFKFQTAAGEDIALRLE